MKKHLVRICIITLILLLFTQSVHAEALENGAKNIVDGLDTECWIVPPSVSTNRNKLVLNTTVGVNCLPETVPAKLFVVEQYEADMIGYKGEYFDAAYTLDYVVDGNGDLVENFDFSKPDLYTVHATVKVPQGYRLSTDPAYKRSIKFYFIITVTAPAPDWCFSYNKISPAYVDTGAMPEEWHLQDSVFCYIYDQNLSHQNINIGMLPITWDLTHIVGSVPDKNGEYEATVSGTLTIPEDIDIDGVDGINGSRTVFTEIYVIVRNNETPFDFVKPTKYQMNPSIKYGFNNEPYVSFEVNYIEKSWDSHFSIWFTEDDGKTFTDVSRSNDVVITAHGKIKNVVSFVDFYNLEYNTWYGVCLELKDGNHSSTITDTIYFMFTENDVNSEPSGGDRNGDGRWPYWSSDFGLQASGNNPSNNSGNNSSNSGDGSTPWYSYSFNDLFPVARAASATFGNNTGTITGQRLDALMKVYPKYVPFVDNGAQIQIPTEFLASLNITKNDTLSMDITPIVHNNFSIVLKLNGKAVDLAGIACYTLYIPYTPPTNIVTDYLVVTDTDGHVQTLSYYDTNGFIVLKTNAFGSFIVITGKPENFSDIQNSFVDFLSVRGLIAGASNEKLNAAMASRGSDILNIIEKLPGGDAYSGDLSSEKSYLTYSTAVDLLASYAKLIGAGIKREEIMSLLSVSDNAILTHYGCIKLVVGFMKLL